MNDHDIISTSTPRVRPRVWVGVLAFLAYLAVFYAIWIGNGIDYARIGESEETLLRWYVAPLTGGLLVILVVVLLRRDCRSGRDRTRAPAVRSRDGVM